MVILVIVVSILFCWYRRCRRKSRTTLKEPGKVFLLFTIWMMKFVLRPFPKNVETFWTIFFNHKSKFQKVWVRRFFRLFYKIYAQHIEPVLIFFEQNLCFFILFVCLSSIDLQHQITTAAWINTSNLSAVHLS